MNIRLLLLLLLLPALSGCVQTKIIDEVNVITGAGIDYTEDDKLQISTITTRYSAAKEAIDEYLEITMEKSGSIENNLNRQSSETVLIGDLDIVVIGEKAAKEGVFPIIDTLQRNPSVGSRLFLALTEGSVPDLMKGTYGTLGNSIYISNLIEHNMKSRDIPKTNLHLFSSDYFQKDKGSFLPILKRLPGDKLGIAGLGLFHKEKLVHTIPTNDMFYFKLLVDKHTDGTLIVKVGKDDAVVNSIGSRVILHADYKKLTFEIDYTLKGIVKQYTGTKVEAKVIDAIKRNLEQKIEKNTLKLLNEFQEMGIDPVGVQRKFKQQNRNFDKNKWKDQYKEVTFKLHPKVIITESGTLE
ncbi:Ger(x)C family spore germination protein [Bacillus sp. FSL K6-3431]|uniref:Ger(x)C family spore germination protein n=1 Tax=Bacillus sp. FSL K6-3431 TaxID=2921500 RepID=UPI0030FD0402